MALVQYILSDYVEQAMMQAVYDKLEDGTFVGRIPICKGVISFGVTLSECESFLQSTLEDWILLGLKLRKERIVEKITIQEVEHVANLARLEFSEEDKQKLAQQLGRILEYIEKLNELDTENVGPTSHVIPVKNVLRPDIPNQSLTQDEALANAPSKVDGLFEVPKIIE